MTHAGTRRLSFFARTPAVAAVLATLVAALAAAPAAAENPGKRKAAAPSKTGATDAKTAGRPDVDNPIVQLVRDPLVEHELQLGSATRARLDAAYDKIAPKLWLVRDYAVGQGAVEKAELLASMEAEIEKILDPPARERLQQLVLRARGWPAVAAEPTAGRLKLAPEQIAEIERINADTAGELQRIASANDSPAAREAAIAKARSDEGSAIQALLSAQQRTTLAQLVGGPFDLAQVRPLTFPAPEIAAVDTWLNASGLKLADQRGKVVAFHFWAFNCGNCINNLPHYTRWHDELASRGLVVLGMHTAETQAERNVATLRGRLATHKIRYAVAVDHDNANWTAWANSMWPSVYLVDKQGRVRYWWYGEMNWQGIEGEKLMRGRIEQLLAEKE